MFTLEQVNKEIEELENNGTLTKDTCSQLCWLYTIRNEIGKQNKPVAAISMYSQAKSPINRTYQEEVQPLTLEEAEEWTADMGKHWNYKQAQEVMARKEISGSPIDFYAALDLMYFMFSKVAEKYNVDGLDFYVDMAQAFIGDNERDKVAAYYEFVAK